MAKPLSLNEIRHGCARLASDWRDEPGDEKQQAHEFVRELLAVFGITERKAALYEKRAQRSSTGDRGYIDALVPGRCAIEMKSKGKDLEEAERQALDYLDSLNENEMPQWVITSDFANFRVLDIAGERGSNVEMFTLEELPRHAEALIFLAGYQVRSFGDKAQEKASVKAARLMARLYEQLDGTGYGDHEASIFLVRLLFCLYADDSGLWERDLFYEFLETRTSDDGSDLGPQLAMLFQVLNRQQGQRQNTLDEMIARFPYVNGGIFAEATMIPSLNRAMRSLLIESCAFDWAGISPAIFGSLFQAVKSPEARRELGEHYTTETNILKTIQPLFLDGLRDNFARHVHDVAELRKLRRTLSEIRILDPACGCGNFLVVAYRELRQLDLDILVRLQELGDRRTNGPTIFFTEDDLAVTLDHFAGIEIEEWPARIATTALHLANHQANQRMELVLGKAPEALPLDKIEPIHVGNALRTDWSTIMRPNRGILVVGNPPFSGARVMTPEQKSDLQSIWGQSGSDLDYVTGWYRKAADYLRNVRGARFAFVSTNSIAQGQPVSALFRPLLAEGWRIRFAHQTFAWSSEAPGMAHVHCVIIGFDRGESTTPVLYTYDSISAAPTRTPAKNVNSYLLDAPDAYVSARRGPLSAGLPSVQFGSMANDGGHLMLDGARYVEAAKDKIAARYIRRFVGARELIHGVPRWCLWLRDVDPADVARSTVLVEHIAAVRQHRLDSKRAATRALAATPHLFGEDRQPGVPYLCIPRHYSEKRPFMTTARMDPDVIAGDANFTALDPDGLLFAMISSSMFIAWQRAAGGRIKSDPRFSATVVWNNLPLPQMTDSVRTAVIAAGNGVLAARSLHPERSLADHYNPLAMDRALVHAHTALDRIVDRAFGAKNPLHTDAERQTLLFRRYVELTNVGSAGEAPLVRGRQRRGGPGTN